MHSEWSGTFPAIVTPFNQAGDALDRRSYERLLHGLLDSGISGVVVAGSTGESSTLSDDEYRELIKFSQDIVGKRSILVAGINANDTRRACELASFLGAQRVDGILVGTPPYNKPTQEGVIAHFRAIKKACNLPLIAYNIPGRSVVNLLPRTVASLFEDGSIAAIKEASGSLDQVLDIVSLTEGKLPILSGEDSLVHPLMACGGTGVISASANLIPDIFVSLTSAWKEGRSGDSLQAQLDALPIVRTLFTETNPIPLKAALHLKGLIDHPTVRLPLTNATESTMQLLRGVLL